MLQQEHTPHLERVARAACRYRDARRQFLQSLQQRPGEAANLHELYLQSHAAEEALFATLEEAALEEATLEEQEQETVWRQQSRDAFPLGLCPVEAEHAAPAALRVHPRWASRRGPSTQLEAEPLPAYATHGSLFHSIT